MARERERVFDIREREGESEKRMWNHVGVHRVVVVDGVVVWLWRLLLLFLVNPAPQFVGAITERQLVSLQEMKEKITDKVTKQIRDHQSLYDLIVRQSNHSPEILELANRVLVNPSANQIPKQINKEEHRLQLERIRVVLNSQPRHGDPVVSAIQEDASRAGKAVEQLINSQLTLRQQLQTQARLVEEPIKSPQLQAQALTSPVSESQQLTLRRQELQKQELTSIMSDEEANSLVQACETNLKVIQQLVGKSRLCLNLIMDTHIAWARRREYQVSCGIILSKFEELRNHTFEMLEIVPPPHSNHN